MNSPVTQEEPSFARRLLPGRRHEWIIWAVVWCLARGLLLVSFADVFGYGEEPEKACAGKAMLDGLPIPHHQLAYHYYEGGGFVVSHLDALAFALLGESLLAVKLVALGLGAAVLWAGWRLCERFGGRNAARVFALLFVFAPASVQKLSLLSLGIHFHALLFVALVIDATTRLIVERKLAARVWLELGLAAGFGLYFSYQLVLTIFVALVALVIGLRHDLLQKSTWFGALGFALGISPLLWMASQVGGAVFDIHGAEVGGDGGGTKLELLRAFFASVFADRSVLDGVALLVLCAGPLLGLLALQAKLRSGLRICAWIVTLHIAVFLLAYVASGFTVGRVYHYFLLNRLTPLWGLAMLLTTLGAAAAWSSARRWQRTMAGVVIAALISFGAIDLFRLVRDAVATQPRASMARLVKQNLELLARTKGYIYPEYLTKISVHIPGGSADRLRVFLQFRESRQDDGVSPPTVLHEAIALALYGDGAREIEEIQRELAAAGVENPHGFYLGLGSLLRAQLRGNIASRVRAVEARPQPPRDALIAAVGRFGLGTLDTEDRVFEEVRQGLVADLPLAYFEGVGRRMYDASGRITKTRYFEMTDGPWILNRGRAEAYAATLPGPVASALMRGYQAARQERWIDPPPWWM